MVNTKTGLAEEPSMKILIADDHWVVRESLKQVTKQLSRNFEPIEAADFNEALAILEQDRGIGLMLIDLIMPGFAEFDGLRILRSRFPEIPIVVISIHDDPEYVLDAISHGVIGYIPKTASAEEIIRSLTRVISGEVSFPRHIIERSGLEPGRGGRRGDADGGVDLDVLTSRERDVLALIGEGTPVSKIAIKLSISPQTVRVHLGNAMKKLDLKNREEAIHFAVNNVRALVGGS
ncbi:MAG: response regulator transcription factor [Alphaproteobacteria bacterium]